VWWRRVKPVFRAGGLFYSLTLPLGLNEALL
jgi:hypothetical protein